MKSKIHALKASQRLAGWAFILCCVVLAYASCSKKDSNSPKSKACKIASFTDSSTGNSVSGYTISYNDGGKISAIQQTGGSNPMLKVFAYNNNVIIATTTMGGSFFQLDSIVLNSDGMMTYRVSTDASAVRTVDTYNYSANGQIQSSTEQKGSGRLTITTYQFTNGDLTSSSDGTIYSYYTDKPSEDGDYLRILYFVNYGSFFVKNTHLIKGFQASGVSEIFSYTFDADGKIITATGTGGSNVDARSFQYNCN